MRISDWSSDVCSSDLPGLAPLLEGLDFEVAAGERLAIVGESGSGKTMATRAIPGLLAAGVHRAAGSIRFEGRDLTTLRENDLRAIRGAGIGIDRKSTSLNSITNAHLVCRLLLEKKKEQT